MLTGIEGGWPTFQDVLRKRSNRALIQRAYTTLRRATMSSVTLKYHDEFSVTQDWHVGVVSARNNLSLPFKLSKPSNNTLVDEIVVQVVLGVVDDERRIRCAEQQE